MSANLHVGQKVVCVDDKPHPLSYKGRFLRVSHANKRMESRYNQYITPVWYTLILCVWPSLLSPMLTAVQSKLLSKAAEHVDGVR